MCGALELSKYIVSKCIKDSCPISNLQLQKILYYIQKAFLKLEKLAFPEEIEAWQFGPVVPIVYYEFSAYGAMKITDDYNLNGTLIYSEEEFKIIDKIVEEKRCYYPWDLVEDTHKVDGAWYSIYHGNTKSNIIPKYLIKAEI